MSRDHVSQCLGLQVLWVPSPPRWVHLRPWSAHLRPCKDSTSVRLHLLQHFSIGTRLRWTICQTLNLKKNQFAFSWFAPMPPWTIPHTTYLITTSSVKSVASCLTFPPRTLLLPSSLLRLEASPPCPIHRLEPSLPYPGHLLRYKNTQNNYPTTTILAILLETKIHNNSSSNKFPNCAKDWSLLFFPSGHEKCRWQKCKISKKLHDIFCRNHPGFFRARLFFRINGSDLVRNWMKNLRKSKPNLTYSFESMISKNSSAKKFTLASIARL